jgi:hypothetical protein
LTVVFLFLAACQETPIQKNYGSRLGDRLMTEQAQIATERIATFTPTSDVTVLATPCGPADSTYYGPVVCSFTVTFVQAEHTTYYMVVDQDYPGSGWKYTWTNSNPCGQFFAWGPTSAKWVHPDSDLPGACPEQAVHPGTITVVISSASGSVKCEYLDGSAGGGVAQCVNQ